MAGIQNCPTCGGSGYIEQWEPGKVPYTVRCKCLKKKELAQALNRVWPGLGRSVGVVDSPLAGYLGKNLWASGSKASIKAHLREVIVKSGRPGDFRVYDDVDLPRAWLGELKDYEIIDVELSLTTPQARDLTELIDLPKQLVLFLGVKHNPMQTMPRTLLETLNRRERVDKPTWVFDSSEYPLTDGHVCFSGDIMDYLSPWDHIMLEGGQDSIIEEGGQRSGFLDIPAGSPTQAPTKKKKGTVPMALKGTGKKSPKKKNGMSRKGGGGKR